MVERLVRKSSEPIEVEPHKPTPIPRRVKRKLLTAADFWMESAVLLRMMGDNERAAKCATKGEASAEQATTTNTG